jgi:hypothetical protein
MSDELAKGRNMARWLRLSVIRNVLASDYITRDDAIDLLKGPLTPGDPTSIVDDSNLIDASIEEVSKVLRRLTLEMPNE